jgi:hypothetical protein
MVDDPRAGTIYRHCDLGAIGGAKTSRCIYPFADDGFNPMPPMICYFRPYSDDLNESHFRQSADGEV